MYADMFAPREAKILKSTDQPSDQKSTLKSVFHIRNIYTVLKPFLYLSRINFAGPYYLTADNELKTSRIEAIFGPIILFIVTSTQSFLAGNNKELNRETLMGNPFMLLSLIRGMTFGIYFTLHAFKITKNIKKVHIIFQKLKEVDSILVLSQKQLRRAFAFECALVTLWMHIYFYLVVQVVFREIELKDKIRVFCIVQDVTTPNMIEMQFANLIFLVGIYIKLVQDKLKEVLEFHKPEDHKTLKMLSQ